MGVVQSCFFAENVKRVDEFGKERVHVQVMEKGAGKVCRSHLLYR
ncbi:hypothetical protein [Peribacillus simplex]|nr:hypothetical protein [Peribacillus simplex]WHY55451.1 hypothetical protein QNH43_20150 [Peribacillus simplex]